MGIKIGIVGLGRFASHFILLFNKHPDVEEIVLCDLDPERTAAAARRFGISSTAGSMEELLASGVTAIGLFTPRHLHGPQALAALKAGKHVYSAVPPTVDLESLEELTATARETGLTHMSAETSLFYPATLYCQKRFRNGDFGRFVYAEAQYIHDLDHLSVYMDYLRTGEERFRRDAGLPPMFYATHSISMPLAVTGAHVTEVTCMGYVDQEGDQVYGPGNNHWDNPFSNQSALMRTSDGGVMRINEMRRAGWRGKESVQMRCYGTKAAFEQYAQGACWITNQPDGAEDIYESQLKLAESETLEGALGEAPRCTPSEVFGGVSPVHPVDELPDTFRGLPNSSHCGSHAFLVNTFVRSLVEGRQPPGNLNEASNWVAAGLLAHESALEGGVPKKVPDFAIPG